MAMRKIFLIFFLTLIMLVIVQATAAEVFPQDDNAPEQPPLVTAPAPMPAPAPSDPPMTHELAMHHGHLFEMIKQETFDIWKTTETSIEVSPDGDPSARRLLNADNWYSDLAIVAGWPVGSYGKAILTYDSECGMILDVWPISQMPTSIVFDEPLEITLRYGQTSRVKANILDQDGQLIPDLKPVYFDNFGKIPNFCASVDKEGNVTPRYPGRCGIGALFYRGGSGFSPLIVHQTPVTVIVPDEPSVRTSLIVTAPTNFVRIGETIKLKATVLDQFGRDMKLPVSWLSNLNARATVTGGVVKGIAVGQVRIWARNQGVRGFITLNVVP